jgi:hypothetical protein
MTTALSTEVALTDIDRLARPWWTCWAALHWGFRAHACCLWACHGEISAREAQTVLGANVTYPLSLVIVYRELVREMVPENELAKMIVDVTPKPERYHLSRFVSGHSVFAQSKDSRIRPIHTLIDDVTVPAGFPRLRISDDSQATGVTTVRMVFDGLRNSLTVRGDDPPKEKRNTPLLLISSDCEHVISTIPGLEFDPKDPENARSVGTKKDSVWGALGNLYRDYPSIVSGKPIEVLRSEAVNKSDDPTQRHINLLKFNEDFEQGQSRPRKR